MTADPDDIRLLREIIAKVAANIRLAMSTDGNISGWSNLDG